MKVRSRKGSALIEFAGSLMLLSAMFTGIFQIGYMFFSYEKLVHAVRAGARYASLRGANSTGIANAEFPRAVANVVVFGDPQPAAGAKPVVSGINADNVELVLGPSAATVSVRDFEIDALFTKIKLAGRPTVTFPYTTGGAK